MCVAHIVGLASAGAGPVTGTTDQAGSKPWASSLARTLSRNPRNEGGKIEAKSVLRNYTISHKLYYSNVCLTLSCFQMVSYTLFLPPSIAR